MAYEVSKVYDGTWSILNEGFVRVFILEGEKEALIIDTGANFPEIKKVIEELTSKPYKLVLTHADFDHASGTPLFDSFYMHSSEASNYYNRAKLNCEYIPVGEGYVFDLGGRHIEVIHLPGHTPGSIGLLDIEGRVLFGGDGIQDGEIFMFGEQRELHAYCHSLRKLDAYRDRFDKVYASHGSLEMEPAQIDRLYDAAKGIPAGQFPCTDREMFGNKISVCNVGCATFLLEHR